MKRLWRAFVALVMFREIDPGGQPVSEYVAEERRILRDAACRECERNLAAAALQPDSLPIVWSDSHDPDNRDCACRGCHRALVDMTSDEAIRELFGELVAADPLLLGLSRQRGRKWTP